MSGRTFAIGDVHGCNVALDTMLARLQPADDDTIVILGDVVDRGPGTRQAIDRLIALQEQCRVVLILGNHEDMLFEALERSDSPRAWLAFGGIETLESYGGRLKDIPPDHIDFMQSGLGYWESDTHIFVHANLEPEIPLHEQSALWLRWEPLRGDEQPHPSGKRVVCGHTSQKWGTPAVGDGWICIDTFCHGGMWLTCLDVDADELFQSNQQGHFRGPFSVNDLA